MLFVVCRCVAVCNQVSFVVVCCVFIRCALRVVCCVLCVVISVVCCLLIVVHRVSLLGCCLLCGVNCFVFAAVLFNALFDVCWLFLVVC